MPSAREARDWVASGGLHGIGNSLYTPFRGADGEEVDYEAYCTLVRYCVGDLKHPMLWLTSGVSEWWSLTMDERKKLVELSVQEARAIAPDTVIQVATIAASVVDTVELTQHAQSVGADICFIQTPNMEVHPGEGLLRFYQFVADRTDIALGVFPSPSSGYLMTAKEVAMIAEAIPAVCAVKEGHLDPALAKGIHKIAPEIEVWECNGIVYTSGWLQKGIVGPAQYATSGYLYEIPDRPILTEYWTRIWDGHLEDAIRYSAESGLDAINEGLGNWRTANPARPDYFCHWGEAFKVAASVLGLPPGEYPYSRPPQGTLPDIAKQQIRAAYEKIGFAREPIAV
jgi:4-hydroxy-tetrahydrodipicolinate synthase